MLDESNEEIRRANHYIVASSVSKQSLVNLGVSNSDIILVPYGTNLFPSYIANYGRPKDSFESPRLRCLFIGSLTYAKGAKHYSDAILSLPKDKYEFHFAGTYDVSSPLYSLLCSSVVFHGHLSRSHLMSVLQNTDILVFPSLVDGFGLSVLEAFSMGVPVICSSGAGVKDIVRNNIDGIIVKSGSSHEICKSLEYLNDNRQLLAKMSENAYFQSIFYTWERYHSELASHFLNVVEGAQNDT
jgi:glycosyltransferase involved in cell wall biosynthesis